MYKQHHNYHNYQNYQNKNNNSKVEEKMENTSIEQVTETGEVETRTEEEKNMIGIVVDCAKLRVRAAANTDAEVLCEINADTKVEIDSENSTNDFYKICTETGIEGYCMKQFISVE